MPLDDDIGSVPDWQKAQEAFARRLMQQALLHRVESGIEPIAGTKFKHMGVLEESRLPDVDDALLRMLRYPVENGMPPGPLVFHATQDAVEVLNVTMVLLQPALDARQAAFAYLERGANQPGQWLTNRTADIIRAKRDECLTEAFENADQSCLEVAVAVGNDLFAQIAGLRQSLVARFEDGLQEFARQVLRPTFETLAELRPPVWSPGEERQEILARIHYLSDCDTIEEALDGYLEFCGYLPLASSLSAAEVGRVWLRKHRSAAVDWEQLREWAGNADSPVAVYHAVAVLVGQDALKPVELPKGFWRDCADIVDCEMDQPSDSGVSPAFRLRCELARHYLQHLEAMHPGQDGNRATVYAWWLADLVAKVFGNDGAMIIWAMQQLIGPEAELSSHRWIIARSPSSPSMLRYVTLFNSSVWAMSLIAQLSKGWRGLSMTTLEAEERIRLGTPLIGYVLGSPLAHGVPPSEPLFAFDENNDLGTLAPLGAGVATSGEELILAGLAQYSDWADLTRMAGVLEELPANEPHFQRFVLRYVKETVFCSRRLDDELSRRLAEPQWLMQIVQNASPETVSALLEVYEELQHRPYNDMLRRLPHLIAHAAEGTDGGERAELLCNHIVLLAVNAGIVSPLQRVLSSQWQQLMVPVVAVWRRNLLDVAKVSEPWVMSRIRSVIPALSQLVGI